MKKTLWKCFGPPPATLMGILTASLCVSLITGCGGAAKSSQATALQYAETASETMAAAASYDAAAPAAYTMDYGAAEEAYDMEWGEPMENASSVLTGSGSITPTSSIDRKLIRNVSMNVETDAFDDLLKKLEDQVTQMSGYIQQSDISGSSMNDYYPGRNRSAFMTARIPSDRLDQFISVVENNGNVTYRSESTQDVTLQYSDLESKKKTLTVEQERIWALLEKADTLEAVIALEERLSEIRYELESMESQLKLYDNQVQYSTIDISINEVTPIDFTPTAPETVGQRIQKGFTRNMTGVFTTLTDLFILFITASPVWLPLALICALVVILIRKVTKRRLYKNLSSYTAPESQDDK